MEAASVVRTSSGIDLVGWGSGPGDGWVAVAWGKRLEEGSPVTITHVAVRFHIIDIL